MRTSVRVAWRVAAAVAFAGTAVLAVTLTRGAPQPAALTSARDSAPAGRHAATEVPRCAPSGLDISIAGRAVPTARVFATHEHVHRVTVPVEFTNNAMTACSAAGRKAPAFLHVRAVQPGAEPDQGDAARLAAG